MARSEKGENNMKIIGFRSKRKKSTQARSVRTSASGGTATKVQPETSFSTKTRPEMPARTVRRRRKRRKSPLLLVGTLLVLTAFAVFVQQALHLNVQEDAHLSYIAGIPVHEDFLPEGCAARPGQKRQIKYVVIHETDNTKTGANAEAHNHYLHGDGQNEKTSWHYTVDDHEIWHHIPDDETAYHAGDGMKQGGGNMNGIGVEMCVNADGDYEQTLQNAQKLAATLLYEYGLSIDDLKKHQDFSGKNCPSQLLNNGRWDEFVQGVQEQLAQLDAK